MKILVFLFTLSLGSVPLFAQWKKPDASNENLGFRSSVFYHKDGTRSEIQTNYTEGTAEEKFYQGKRLIRRVTYVLDERGQHLQGDSFDAKDKLVYRFSYLRDSQGRIAEESNFLPNGELFRRFVFTYTNEGQIAKIVAYGKDGELLPTVNDGATRRNNPPKPKVQTPRHR